MPIHNGRALRQLTNRAENQLRDAILTTAEEFGGQVERDIRAALRSGNTQLALSRLPVQRVIARLEAEVARVVRNVYEGSIEIGVLPTSAPDSLRRALSLTNPKAVDYIRTTSFNTALKIGADIEALVRREMTDAFVVGRHPYEVARRIAERVGLTPNQVAAVDNMEDFLTSLSERDLTQGLTQTALHRLQRAGFRGVSGASLARTGLTDGRISDLIEKYRNRMLSERAVTIARTLTIDASSAGQQALWSEASQQGYLQPDEWEVEWIITDDDRLCDECAEMEGQRRTLEGTYQNGADRPPLHLNCRCAEGLVRL